MSFFIYIFHDKYNVIKIQTKIEKYNAIKLEKKKIL